MTDVSDAVIVFGYLFRGLEAPARSDAADADDNGRVEATDVILVLSALFLGAGEIPAPGLSACGIDPARDRSLPARARIARDRVLNPDETSCGER